MSDAESETLLLSDVAETGVLTAFGHAIESRSRTPLLRDPQAEAIATRLAPRLARSRSKLLERLARGRMRDDLVVYFAIRARKYDQYAREFVQRHPGGCIVNLGCGLDTRFWRIDDGCLQLYDLDLPEMIALKRQLVAETDRYHLIGQSVLEYDWMDRLIAEQAGPFLFLAEGLFMYLPPNEARALIVALHSRFPGSELVFETVNSLWLQPAFRWLVDFKLQYQLGLGHGARFQFGIRDAHEPERWSPGLRLLDEWTYFDEDEPRLGLVRYFRHWNLLRYIQWTVHYLLAPGEPPRAA